MADGIIQRMPLLVVQAPNNACCLIPAMLSAALKEIAQNNLACEESTQNLSCSLRNNHFYGAQCPSDYSLCFLMLCTLTRVRAHWQIQATFISCWQALQPQQQLTNAERQA